MIPRVPSRHAGVAFQSRTTLTMGRSSQKQQRRALQATRSSLAPSNGTVAIAILSEVVHGQSSMTWQFDCWAFDASLMRCSLLCQGRIWELVYLSKGTWEAADFIELALG
jgi:hypothetical protein